MSLYKLRAEGKEFDLKVVKNMPFGGDHGVIVYESAGGDGGVVITTGRYTKKVSLNGSIIGSGTTEDEVKSDLRNKINELTDLKDRGVVVKLVSPLAQNDTGSYIINSFNGTIQEGQMKTIEFSMALTEHKQTGVKRSAVNLVNFQPAELMKMRARDRNILSG
jgi:hypothetical protein